MKRILVVLSLMPVMAFATTWYVDGTTGTDENSGTSPAEAKATIQAAIDVADANDSILVMPGIYSHIVSENKMLTIRSEQGYDKTVIEGGNYVCAQLGTGSLADFPTPTNTVLIGFTCRNGYGGVNSGTLYNCVITNNTANGLASGIGWAIAHNCLIADNRAINGGGATGAVLINCTVVGNYAIHNGGGSYDSCLINSVVYDNSSGLQWDGEGGNIFNLDDDPILKYPKFVNSCTVNPRFVDAVNGDYRLAAGSPCIDAGDNAHVTSDTDLDGFGRIANGIVDIGCYEFESDGGPYVEKVGDVEWTYMIKKGRASVGDGNTVAATNLMGAISVPSRLRQRPVVAIDGNAFLQCEGLTSVTIPASVKTIGNSAFWGCSRLADVYFEGDTISSIGHEAFTDCYWDLIMHVSATWKGRGRTICGYTVLKGCMFIVK